MKRWHTLCVLVAGADEELAYDDGGVRLEAATERTRADEATTEPARVPVLAPVGVAPHVVLMPDLDPCRPLLLPIVVLMERGAPSTDLVEGAPPP